MNEKQGAPILVVDDERRCAEFWKYYPQDGSCLYDGLERQEAIA